MLPNEVYWTRCLEPLDAPVDCSFPELLSGARPTQALLSLRNLMQAAGLDSRRFGSRHWNPLEEAVGLGKKIVIKPNWVHHRNASGGNLDCLITSTDLIEATIEYLALTKPHSLLVADAPIQSCDFDALLASAGVDKMLARFASRGVVTSCSDLRLTALKLHSWSGSGGTSRSESQYVRFNLGTGSYLEPVTTPTADFRVTRYDPKALGATHRPGHHEYLIARELLEADCVINMPKLKTHKKAGITGALKNLVGANGHKSFLPHHRKRGSARGGDCYPGTGALETWTEELLDRANCAKQAIWKEAWGKAASVAMRMARTLKPGFDVEGSWHGNDTVWRMVLDLQTIVLFGTEMGSIEQTRQRVLLNLTDAVIAGEGEGPLAPEPIQLGVLTLGTNAAACDWIHAQLMGLDPLRIPLLREACGDAASAIAPFERASIRLSPANSQMLESGLTHPFRMPAGWRGACEADGVGAIAC